MSQPQLDEDLVQRLATIACALMVVTQLPMVYYSTDSISWLARTSRSRNSKASTVRKNTLTMFAVLTDRATEATPDLGREGLIEMFSNVLADPCDDAYLQYVFTTIIKTFGDTQISDLVFGPAKTSVMATVSANLHQNSG